LRLIAIPLSEGFSLRERASQLEITQRWASTLLDQLANELLTGSPWQTHVLETRDGRSVELEGLLIREKNDVSVFKLSDGSIASYNRKTLKLDVI
jgi:hypothetical protein